MVKYSSRFTAQVKRKWAVNPNDNLDVIILAAGFGKMKTHGSRSLLDIKSEKLGQRQVRIIRECYPNANIIYGVGFQADKVIDSLPQNIRFIENTEYETTSPIRTLSLCLRAALNPNVLLIMGDLVFNNEYVADLFTPSSRIVCDSNSFKQQEIGVNSFEDNLATLFAFNLPKKWGQVGFFTHQELFLLKKFVHNREHSQCCMFESLNYIIDNGGQIFTKHNDHGSVLEIDSVKDTERL